MKLSSSENQADPSGFAHVETNVSPSLEKIKYI